MSRPRRGVEFVTRKVSRAVGPGSRWVYRTHCRWEILMRSEIGVFAGADYVEAMYLMLQQQEADDYNHR